MITLPNPNLNLNPAPVDRAPRPLSPVPWPLFRRMLGLAQAQAIGGRDSGQGTRDSDHGAREAGFRFGFGFGDN